MLNLSRCDIFVASVPIVVYVSLGGYYGTDVITFDFTHCYAKITYLCRRIFGHKYI
jgi:hypothetical protein